jgi:hypothetical protein
MAARAGIGCTPLDNGFAAVDDVTTVQAICDSFDEKVIWDLAAKWTAMLPCPFTDAGTAAGYRYEVSVLQAGFSLTQVLDKPVTGRIFFEQVIRGNLGIGRPDQVGLIFSRRIIRKGPRATPGRFRTRVLTDGVIPTLHIDYKHSKIVSQAKPVMMLARWNSPPRLTRRGDWPKPAAASAMVVSTVMAVLAL